MSLKSNPGPDDRQATTRATTTLLLHDITDQSAPAKADARRRRLALQPAAGAANHARHHIARQKQS